MPVKAFFLHASEEKEKGILSADYVLLVEMVIVEEDIHTDFNSL